MEQQGTIDSTDPILEKRERIARRVGLAMKVGYGLFALAIILFFIGLVTNTRTAVSTPVMWCILIGSPILAPAIVFKYALKAARRADAEGSW